jgi:hypothetical protein
MKEASRAYNRAVHQAKVRAALSLTTAHSCSYAEEVAATLEVALCVIQWSWPVRIDANLISGL